MLKKYIIFGSAVLLLAALFTLTGCSQATDSDGGGIGLSENHLFGTASAADVKAAVASAQRTGRAVILTDNTTLAGPGAGSLTTVASFENVAVRVEGEVTVTANIIINAAFASMIFEEDATITVENGGAFIYQGNGDHILTAPAMGYKVRYMTDPLMAVQGTDARIAIPSYRVGANANDIAPHVTHLYVADKVTLDSASDLAGLASITQIIALGEVDLVGNVGTLGTSYAKFGFTADSILTSSVPENITIDLPVAASLAAVKAATPITIVGPATSITGLIIDKVEGPDTLTISAGTSIAALRINEVAESGKVVVDTPTIVNGGGTTVYGLFVAKNNAGLITLNTSDPAGVAGRVVAENNTGTLNINTSDFKNANGLVIPRPANFPVVAAPYTLAGSGVNSGTIAITAGTFTGPVAIATANTGTVTLDVPVIGAAVTIAANSGTVNFVTNNVTTAAVITTNTGEVNFTKDLVTAGLVGNFISSLGNQGAINFWGRLTTVNPLGALPGTPIAGNGKVSFGALAEFTKAATIGCDTEFKGGLTRTDEALFLGGNVTLDYGQVITLTDVDNFTLGAGKKILVGGTPVLSAGNTNVVITPATGAKLTAGAARTSGDDDSYVGDRTLTLDTAEITAITGNLRVAGGAYLSIAVADGIDVGTGSLTLEDGAFIELALHATNGDLYTVTLGDTVIAGQDAAASYLTASGGAVTLASDSISGNGTLLIPEESGSPTITVDPLSSAGVTLTIAANLNLQYNGALVLTGGVGNKIVLEAGEPAGKITLSDETDSTVTSLNNTTISDGTQAADITGGGVLRGTSETGSSTIGDISGGKASHLVINSDGSNTVTIDATGTVVILPTP
jgi:hypothetical protein